MIASIKLMPDYACYPLWWEGGDRVGNIDPATLPLRQETVERLYRWAKVYDATLNWDDPANSPGFLSREAQEAFEQEGIALWKQLQQELPPHFTVYYFSDRFKKLVSNLEELEKPIYQRPYIFDEENVIYFYGDHLLEDSPVEVIGKGDEFLNGNGDVIVFDKNGNVSQLKRPKDLLDRGIAELISI